MTGDHVPSEIPEHLEIRALVRLGVEEGGRAAEEGFREEEEGDHEGEAGRDGPEPVVPLPASGVPEKAAN